MDRVFKFFFIGFVKKIHGSGSGGPKNYGLEDQTKALEDGYLKNVFWCIY
jgi:hypothetical protein